MVNFNVTPIHKPTVALSALQSNAQDLAKDIAWCEQVIRVRFSLYFQQETSYESVLDIAPPSAKSYDSGYGQFLQQTELTFTERLALVLALLPEVKPNSMDMFLYRNESTERPYTEFGCQEFNGRIYATGETLVFLLSGDDLELRLNIQKQLYSKSQSPVFNLMELNGQEDDVLLMKTPFKLNDEFLHLFTISEPYRPELSESFPAKRVVSGRKWQI
ncbi:hypothetical protein [Vibrio mexicanus]|uniref:hypothetical protein n=1 Tax=Vibrio mexicanus TaxID=1004326 RepID=UPI00069A7571|nr:hypothetical protein [Vibrio mexicanus]